MFTFITNIPIFRRLFLAFLLAALIPGIVITILGSVFISSLNTRSQAAQMNIHVFQTVDAAGSSLSSMHELLNILYQNQYQPTSPTVLPASRQLVRDIRAFRDTFDAETNAYQHDYQIATSPPMRDTLSALQNDNPNTTIPSVQQNLLSLVTKLWPAYNGLQDNILQDIESRTPSAQVTILITQANIKYPSLEKTWSEITQLAQEVSSKITQVGPAQTNPTILGMIIAFLVTVLMMVIIGYIVNLTITRPLRQLASLTTRITKGETSARAKVVGKDEICVVADSMNTMLDNIVRLIHEAQSARDSLQLQAEKLVNEVSGVGEGDLRVQAEVTSNSLGVLADSFNYMVEELGSLVIRVKTVASEVDGSTVTILDHMTQLAETGDRHLFQIEEAAVEVEHVAVSSRQVADRSQTLYDVAREARKDAQQGREAVRQAVEGMGHLNENMQTTTMKVQMLGERSREIDEIMTAIASIAHQMNRLALDAAIQAAMAGQHGKGFGAVAADIRRLAERAKTQAGSITHIVRDIREEIETVALSMQDTEREVASGSKLTQEAGVALESVFTAVEQQAREVEHINQMATQQLTSSNAVVQIMQAISESTQQSSTSTREASQNMERLARLVQQLRGSVEAFKLREHQGYLIPSTRGNLLAQKGGQRQSLATSGGLRTVSATVQSPRRRGPRITNVLPVSNLMPKTVPLSAHALASKRVTTNLLPNVQNSDHTLQQQLEGGT